MTEEELYEYIVNSDELELIRDYPFYQQNQLTISLAICYLKNDPPQDMDAKVETTVLHSSDSFVMVINLNTLVIE